MDASKSMESLHLDPNFEKMLIAHINSVVKIAYEKAIKPIEEMEARMQAEWNYGVFVIRSLEDAKTINTLLDMSMAKALLEELKDFENKVYTKNSIVGVVQDVVVEIKSLLEQSDMELWDTKLSHSNGN